MQMQAFNSGREMLSNMLLDVLVFLPGGSLSVSSGERDKTFSLKRAAT